MKNVYVRLKAAPHITTPVPDVVDPFARAPDDVRLVTRCWSGGASIE